MLTLLALSAAAATPPDAVAGPFLTDIPAGFSLPDKSFVDQDAAPGTQVYVWITQGWNNAQYSVMFETENLIKTFSGAPAGFKSIGRSTGDGDNGTASAGGVTDGRVWATGLDKHGVPALWTPMFNGPLPKDAYRYFNATDTDGDGVDDTEEITVCGTDPSDTDSDDNGFDDQDDCFGTTPGTLAIDASIAYPNGIASATGDLDGDGYQDLAVADNSADVSVFFGGPSGLSGTPAIVYVPGGYADGLAAGDMDGDGIDELAIGNGSSVWVIPGPIVDGMDVSVDHIGRVDGIAAVYNDKIAISDVDGDGLGDLWGGDGRTMFGIWFDDQFPAASVLDFDDADVLLTSTAGSYFGLTFAPVGDVDLDGDPEIAIGDCSNAPGYSGAFFLFRGPFTSATILTPWDADASWDSQTYGAYANGMSAVGDVTGDGRPDLFNEDYVSSLGMIVDDLDTDGDRLLTAAYAYPSTTGALFDAVGLDRHGGGGRQLAFVTYTYGVRVLRGVDPGSSDLLSMGYDDVPGVSYAFTLGSADVNGDGRDDLLITDYSHVSVIYGD